MTTRIASILNDGADVDKPDLRAYLSAREVFNPEDLGAVGDGLADDTQGFQDAVDAAMLVGGMVFCNNPSDAWTLTAPIDISTAAPSSDACKGITFYSAARLSDAGTDQPFRIKHNGVAFNEVGTSDTCWHNFDITNDPAYEPTVGWLLARNSGGDGAGRHTFFNCRARGKFSKAVVGIYGSEENDFYSCRFTNTSRTSGAVVVSVTSNNTKGFASAAPCATLATGAQGTTVQNFVGGSYFRNAPDANVFEIENTDSISISNVWAYAAGDVGSPTENGGALVQVDMQHGPCNSVWITQLKGENSAARMQQYGVRWTSHAYTCTGITIRDCVLPNKVAAISAGALSTLDNLVVDQLAVPAGGGISLGNLQYSRIYAGGPIAISGFDHYNHIVGNGPAWSLPAALGGYHVDVTGTLLDWTPNTGALTVTGALTIEAKVFKVGTHVTLHLKLSAATSIVCAAQTPITGLPLNALYDSADVKVANGATAAAIGAGFVSGGNLYVPAINVTTAPVVITANYFSA